VNFGVPVRKRKTASATVKVGGEVDNLRGREIVSSRAGVREAKAVNAVRMLVHEHKGHGRKHNRGEFIVGAPGGLALVVGFIEPFAVFAKHLTHADATNTRKTLCGTLNSGLVSGAFENSDALPNVGEDWRRYERNARVPVGLFSGKVEPEGGGVINDAIRTLRISPVAAKQVIIVVVRVHAPAEHDLLSIIHALDCLRPALGARQSRQQHRRENGNYRNYDQQFDQRESGCARRRLRPRYYVVHMESIGNFSA